MIYATGGLAFSRVEASDTLAFTGGTGQGSASDFRTGWTAGGGGEFALDRNWTLKAEWLWVDLGSVNFSSGPIVGFPTAVAGHSSDLTLQTVRAGLNYRF